MRIVIIFLLIVLIAAPAMGEENASIKTLLESTPNHNFGAKVVKVIAVDDGLYLKSLYKNESVWVHVVNDKREDYTIGKTYQFYRPYLLSTGLTVAGVKPVLDIVWHSFGKVDTRYKEDQFGFQGCKIGEDIEAVYVKLKGKHKVTRERDNLKIAEFELAGISWEVSFLSDIDKKLHMIMFRRASSGMDNAVKKLALSLISKTFEHKFGKPRRCNDEIDFDTNKSTHCSWVRGEIDIHTDHQINNGESNIRGVIMSASRTLRTFNINAERIENAKKRMANDLNKFKDEIAQDAANQF